MNTEQALGRQVKHKELSERRGHRAHVEEIGLCSNPQTRAPAPQGLGIAVPQPGKPFLQVFFQLLIPTPETISLPSVSPTKSHQSKCLLITGVPSSINKTSKPASAYVLQQTPPDAPPPRASTPDTPSRCGPRVPPQLSPCYVYQSPN